MEQINQVTKLKLIEMMKVNNSSKREEHKILFTQFGVNEPTLGERATLRSTRSKKSLYKKFPIGLQELILILPKIPNLFPWPRDSI